jgi:hypothetical protein
METCMFFPGTGIGHYQDSDHAELMIHQLPPNIYSSSTQLHQVYERLRWGEASGADFLKMGIPEYRSRMNTLEKDLLLPAGFMLKRRRQYGTRFVFFSIINSPRFSGK